jgi:lysophospholipase L1-like esterase
MKKLLVILSLVLVSFKPESNKVLFIGDSLTCYAGGWQAQVCKEMGWGFDNISKGGKRTSWMLDVLTNHLASNHNYKKVFIYGGCNDAYSYVKLTQATNNIQEMVDLCIKYKIEPVVIVGYDPGLVQQRTPYDEKTTKFHRDRYIELQNMMVKHLTNCKIITKDTTVTRKDSDDGLHLKASGHKKFANWVVKQIK